MVKKTKATGPEKELIDELVKSGMCKVTDGTDRMTLLECNFGNLENGKMDVKVEGPVKKGKEVK